MVHQSHISSKEAKSRGWSRVSSPAIREETMNLAQEVGSEYMNGQYLNLNTCTTITTNTTGARDWDVYFTIPQQTWVNPWTSDPNPSVVTIREIIKEKEVTKEVEKRTLFKVYVVDPSKNGKILMDGKPVIAVNENQAMLKAGVADVAEKAGLDLEQVDVYVQPVGTFIRPRKETQRVKMVEKDEE